MGEINGRKVSWIHLSDLHFGGKNGSIPSNAVYDKLLRDIKNIKIPIDFVFVSGDIAFSASPDQYAYAEKFFNEVLDSLWGITKTQRKEFLSYPVIMTFFVVMHRTSGVNSFNLRLKMK